MVLHLIRHSAQCLAFRDSAFCQQCINNANIMSHCRPWRHMLGVETSHHSFLTSTPDADKRVIQAQVASWAPVLFSAFWRRRNSLAPAAKNLFEKNVRPKSCTCLIFPLGATRSVHLIVLVFEHPKIVRWWDHIFKFLIRQFLSKTNLFVPLLKVKSSLEPNIVAVQHKYCYSGTKVSSMFACITLLGFVPLVGKLPWSYSVQ